MNYAFEVGGVGLTSQQQALDIIANNIANVNTPGFKRSDVQFSEMIVQQTDPSNPSAALGAAPSLAGVHANSLLALSDQGEIARTGRPLDLAIEGEGFFELMGPRGQVLLWRGGTLSVNDGVLSTSDGYALRAMIEVPANAASLQIDASGRVSALLSDDADPIELGQIMIVRPDNEAAIERLDGGLYALGDGGSLTEAIPGENGAGNLVQGAIEQSNVQLSDEMVRLMIVQRAYAASAQVLQAADQFTTIANGLRK